MDTDSIPNLSNNMQDPQKPRHPFFGDLPTLITSIGVLAGIADYIYTQNPWLLLTFLSIFLGKNLLDQGHPPR